MWRFQFSLRAYFIATTLLATVLWGGYAARISYGRWQDKREVRLYIAHCLAIEDPEIGLEHLELGLHLMIDYPSPGAADDHRELLQEVWKSHRVLKLRCELSRRTAVNDLSLRTAHD